MKQNLKATYCEGNTILERVHIKQIDKQTKSGTMSTTTSRSYK